MVQKIWSTLFILLISMALVSLVMVWVKLLKASIVALVVMLAFSGVTGVWRKKDSSSE